MRLQKASIHFRECSRGTPISYFQKPFFILRTTNSYSPFSSTNSNLVHSSLIYPMKLEPVLLCLSFETRRPSLEINPWFFCQHPRKPRVKIVPSHILVNFSFDGQILVSFNILTLISSMKQVFCCSLVRLIKVSPFSVLNFMTWVSGVALVPYIFSFVS